MLHLSTEPVNQGLKLTWLTDSYTAATDTAQATLSLTVARTALGVCLNPGFFACVVAERQVEGIREIARYFLVLDEAEEAQAQPLIDRLITLKDRYRCRTLFCANQPLLLVESLRRTDGLSHYRPENPWVAEKKWPSFIDFDVKSGIYAVPLPDETTLHRELEVFLQSEVRFSDSGSPVKDLKGEILRKLMLPNEFNCSKSRAGLRQGTLPACTALWMACYGLDKAPVRLPTHEKQEDRVVDALTGY